MDTPNSSDMENAAGEDYIHIPPRDNREPPIIAVMGVTGSGKSSLIQKVSGRNDIVIGHDLEACTSDVTSFPIDIDNATITVVDTPGFNDTYKSDTEILLTLSQWLELTYRSGIKLTGIVYLHRINNPRMEGSARLNLRMFRKLCGTDALKHVIFATTHWSSIDQSEGERLEKQLIDKFWGELIELGAEYYRYDGSAEQARELIRKAASKGRVDMAIQRELVDLNMSLPDTGAGRAVNEELAELKTTHRLELAQLQEELREAIKASDIKAQEQIRRDRRDHERQLELVIASQDRLHKERGDEMRKLDLAWKTRFQDLMESSRQDKESLEEVVHQLRVELAKGGNQGGSEFDWNGAASFATSLLMLLNQILS